MRSTRSRTRILVSALLFVISIPLGLWFVMHDSPYAFKQLKYLWGFYLSWGLSTLVAWGVMTLVEYGTRVADRLLPWRKAAAKRVAVQLGVGVLVPFAFALAWNAGVFSARKAADHLYDYFDSEVWLTLILLLVFNGVCCLVLFLWKGHFGRTVVEVHNEAAKQKDNGGVAIDVAHVLDVCAYVEYIGSSRQCKVNRMDGTHEWYGVPLEHMEQLLKGPQCCRIFRNHIVARQAIDRVEHNAKKRKCSVFLKAPYGQVELIVGQSHQREFLAWYDAAGS